MSEAAATGVPLVGDPLSAGFPPAFGAPQDFDAAKIRLILVAETLFAEQSIENVSLREIARAAGNGNNNAVQYHFGGKNGLIQAIFAYRVWQMDERRRAGLEALKAAGRQANLPALLELLLLPLLDLTNEAGRHSYAGFIGKYLLLSRPTGLPHAMDSRTETTIVLRQINSALEQQLAHLPADLVINRIALAYLMFINMLIRSDNDGVSARGGPAFRERVSDCLEMATAALRAPVSKLG
jgi:TetR/AcrR family transcriptional regulator, regulator of cefoperazone and chloramphenicol sensitivity